MSIRTHKERVLAIDVRASRFAFVVLDGPEQLLDWGLKHFRQGVNAVKIPPEDKIASLIEEFSPNTVVLKESRSRYNRKRVSLQKIVLRQAQKDGTSVCVLATRSIKKAFPEHDGNKYKIASAVAVRFPELAFKLPGERKIWKPEDHRMSIFDATALGIAYFAQPNTDEGLQVPHAA